MFILSSASALSLDKSKSVSFGQKFNNHHIGTEVMSSKTQTAPSGVRQFYFNPNTGTYIPIASMPNTGEELLVLADLHIKFASCDITGRNETLHAK